MRKLTVLFLCGMFLFLPYLMGAFDKDKPAASTSLRQSNPEILANWSQLQTGIDNEHIFTGTAAGTQTGDHTQGSARCYSQSGAPATRIDGAGFLSTDLGSLWVDTDDNAVYVLTAVAPTWTAVSTEIIETLLGSARVFLDTLGVTGDFAVNTDKFTVAAASGNTAVAGTLAVASTLDVVGNIDPTSYETTNGGFLDEDDLATDSDTAVASQQSVKAYVDAHGLVQVVNTQTGSYIDCDTVFPIDDSIPQITEGDEVMTLAITPTSASNKLKIEIVVNASNQAANLECGAALFQDATAGALAAAAGGGPGNNFIKYQQIKFTHYMTAGTVSETTFKVRLGASSGGAGFNGVTSRIFGGVCASSITITEIKQ